MVLLVPQSEAIHILPRTGPSRRPAHAFDQNSFAAHGVEPKAFFASRADIVFMAYPCPNAMRYLGEEAEKGRTAGLKMLIEDTRPDSWES
jgi:hypothetical protein